MQLPPHDVIPRAIEVLYSVGSYRGKVMIKLGQTGKSLSLTPLQAMSFAELLCKHSVLAQTEEKE